jgi:hypothetical protein
MTEREGQELESWRESQLEAMAAKSAPAKA